MKTLSTLAFVALALASGSAVADGDNVVKVGVTRYDTHSKTDGISGIGVPPGADADVDSATTVIFVYERLLTPLSPNLGLEFVIGIPPTLHAHGTGSVAFLGEVLSAKIIAPTLLLNYHFFGSDTAFRPYLGIGVNYTHYTDIKSSLASDVQMGNSTGLALQGGVNYAINKQFGLFASVAKVNVKSKVVAAGPTVITTTVDFRPIVWSAGVSYQF
jgi:outer membrane protein